MKYKHSKWKQGSVYAIPLADGSFGICQAIDLMMENIIYIAVFSYHFDDVPTEIPGLKKEDILSLGATWRQHLNNGSWATIGVTDPIVEKRDFPNEAFAPSYVGAKHSDGGLFSKFVRRQGFWNQELHNLRESLAHLVCCIMRRACCDASGAFRVSFV